MPVPSQTEASWQIVKAHQGSTVRRYIQAWMFFNRTGVSAQIVDKFPNRPLDEEHEFELSYTPPNPLPNTDGLWHPVCVYIQIPSGYTASTVKVNGVVIDVTGSQPDDLLIELT